MSIFSAISKKYYENQQKKFLATHAIPQDTMKRPTEILQERWDAKYKSLIQTKLEASVNAALTEGKISPNSSSKEKTDILKDYLNKSISPHDLKILLKEYKKYKAYELEYVSNEAKIKHGGATAQKQIEKFKAMISGIKTKEDLMESMILTHAKLFMFERQEVKTTNAKQNPKVDEHASAVLNALPKATLAHAHKEHMNKDDGHPRTWSRAKPSKEIENIKTDKKHSTPR